MMTYEVFVSDQIELVAVTHRLTPVFFFFSLPSFFPVVHCVISVRTHTDTLCAPLWDSHKCQFVGLLTVTDFIDLLYYYSCIIHKDVALLNVESIADIMAFLAQQQQQQLLHASSSHHPNDSAMSDSGMISMGQTATAATYTTITNTTTSSADSNESNASPPPPIGLFSMLQPFRGASTNCTLYRACIQLLQSGSSSINNNNASTEIPKPASPQNFLPIVFVDDMRVLSCITYTTILEFLVTHFREQRRLFDDSIYDLRIGTYGANVITITTQHTLRTAIQLMSQHNLSAIPVLDAVTQKIVAMYSRSDITFLTRAVDAEDAVRNLNLTLYDILSASSSLTSVPPPQQQQEQASTLSTPPQQLPSSSSAAAAAASPAVGGPPLVTAIAPQPLVTTPDALRTCLPTHTLQAIFESFAIQRFNRLCVIDENEHLLGIVSAKDLVAYFLSDTVQRS
jgi:CBS domain-containing protein